MSEEPEIMWEGRFITAVREGHWEYVRRSRGIRAAVILAETDAGEIVLVEQHRIPIGRRCLELPAGLIGDDRGVGLLGIRRRDRLASRRGHVLERRGRQEFDRNIVLPDDAPRMHGVQQHGDELAVGSRVKQRAFAGQTANRGDHVCAIAFDAVGARPPHDQRNQIA